MGDESVPLAELRSILREATEPLLREIAGLRSELASLRDKLGIREKPSERRQRLTQTAIFLIPEHGGALKPIARAVGVPVSTLRCWKRFDEARQKFLGLMRAEAQNRYADHFEGNEY